MGGHNVKLAVHPVGVRFGSVWANSQLISQVVAFMKQEGGRIGSGISSGSWLPC